VATPPSVDSEATALLVARELGALGVRVTRIASGVPHGGDLEFADQVTLGRAIEGAANADTGKIEWTYDAVGRVLASPPSAGTGACAEPARGSPTTPRATPR
jgi:PQQ enzyme repeat